MLTGLAAGIAVAVAASRVLLDVHWLTDVIAGLALGWAWFAVCAIAFGGRLLRFGAAAAVAAIAAATPASPPPARAGVRAEATPPGRSHRSPKTTLARELMRDPPGSAGTGARAGAPGPGPCS